MASAPQDLSEVYLLEKRKGEIEEVNIIPNGKRRCVVAPGPRAAPPPRGRSPPGPKNNPPTPPPPVSAARSLDSSMARGELQYADIILVRGKHFQQLQNAGVQPEAVVVAVVDSVLSATLRLRVHGLDAVLEMDKDHEQAATWCQSRTMARWSMCGEDHRSPMSDFH